MTPSHLQFYAQDSPNADVPIVGTAAGLLALAQLLSQKLFGMAETVQTFYDANGEAFSVRIDLVPDEQSFARYGRVMQDAASAEEPV